MCQKVPAVAQIEFQMPSTGPVSALEEEGRLRLIEGGRSVAVVRFYDLDGSITRMVTRLGTLSRSKEEAYLDCIRSRGLARRFHDWRAKRLAVRKRALEGVAVRLAQRKFEQALGRFEGVAMEPSTRAPFRQVRRDEEHELMERVRRAYGTRFFIFPYGAGELCSDALGESFACYMG